MDSQNTDVSEVRDKIDEFFSGFGHNIFRLWSPFKGLEFLMGDTIGEAINFSAAGKSVVPVRVLLGTAIKPAVKTEAASNQVGATATAASEGIDSDEDDEDDDGKADAPFYEALAKVEKDHPDVASLVNSPKLGLDGVAFLPKFFNEEFRRIRRHVELGEGETSALKRRLEKGNTDTGNIKIEMFTSEFNAIRDSMRKSNAPRALSPSFKMRIAHLS